MVVGLGYPYAIGDLKGFRTASKVSHFRLALDTHAFNATKSGGTPMPSLKSAGVDVLYVILSI